MPSGSNSVLQELDDDNDCPLCMDPMDPGDIGFKPCPCGYQCYHHIKQNLNGTCPACRREYTDDAVEFTPVPPDQLKRIQQNKKNREREKKDLEITSKKQLANVRVKQKTQVHIQGLPYRIANEDMIVNLRSTDQFGQFGKILKLFIAKRTNMPDEMASKVARDPKEQPMNVYINYSSHNEANSCILAMDKQMYAGSYYIRAGWGTTRYCPNYLSNKRCTLENCMMAHEPGEEVDPVGGAPGPLTREEMSTIKHAMKEQETRESGRLPLRPVQTSLPATAGWAKSHQPNSASVSSISNHQPTSSSSSSAGGPSAGRGLPNIPGSVTQRLPKATNHPLPARPPSREAHVAAAQAAARSRESSIHSMAGTRTRRSSTSSNSDYLGMRRASLQAAELGPISNTAPMSDSPISAADSFEDKSASLSRPAGEGSSSSKSAIVGPPPGLWREGEGQVASTSTASIGGGISRVEIGSPPPTQLSELRPLSPDSSSSHGTPLLIEADEPLEPFGGGFSFSLNIDIEAARSQNAKGKEKEQLDLDIHNVKLTERTDNLFGNEYLLSSTLASGIPGTLSRAQSQEGYQGAFDPFAEALGEDENAKRRGSRFDFAKKGLFGSSDSLVGLASSSPVPDLSRQAHLMNGRPASPLSIIAASTALRSASPKRAIAPPPGLSSMAAPLDPNGLWAKSGTNGMASTSSSPFNQSPNNGPIDLPFKNAATLRTASSVLPPLNNAATQPLPAAAAAALALPPGLGEYARQPLPALAASNQPLPPLRSPSGLPTSPPGLPPGMGQKLGNEDYYGNLMSVATGVPLPPRSLGLSPENVNLFADPAILNVNMASAPRYHPMEHFNQYQQQQQQMPMPFQQYGMLRR